jgi:hypothetical protein
VYAYCWKSQELEKKEKQLKAKEDAQVKLHINTASLYELACLSNELVCLSLELVCLSLELVCLSLELVC